MSWPNALVLGVFVCVCGFIAYAGDLLGRRMGKRRLSLFGLRPRYTAIVTTTITGMLIAILTIGTISAVNSQVRLLILRGAQILKEQEEKIEAYSRELRLQKREAREAREDALEAGRQRDLLGRDVQRLTRQLDELSSALKEAQRERSRLMSERDRLSSQLADLKTDLDRNKEVIARAEEELGLTRQNLEKAELDVAARQEEITRLQEKRDRLRRDLAETMVSRVIFRPGEEIARGTVRCAQPHSAIEQDIIDLLGKADERARAEGAKLGTNGRAVEIVTKKLQGDRASEQVILDEAESIDLIVETISSGSGEVVVRVLSIGNSFEGEQASVEIQINYNRLIYSAGQEVASTVIDGEQTRGQILGMLISFLRMEVRYAAIHKGVIPTYDEDGQPSVGGISWEQVLDVVDEVKSAGKKTRVKAVTTRETWSEGPLEIKFESEAP